MKIQAIVYVSNTGFTAQYAQMLHEKTQLPVYTLEEAAKALPAKSSVLYMSWLMAGTLVDYKKAAKQFDVAAACSVGLNATPQQTAQTRKSTAIPENVPLFALQGGYDEKKLRGIYKLMMKLVAQMLIGQISAKSEKTQADEQMLKTLREGGSYVRAENLAPVLSWLRG